MKEAFTGIYEFGPFAFRPSDRSLKREGVQVYLAPRPAAVLLRLLQGRGDPVTKKQLYEDVWGEAEVDQGNLTYQVRKLREALGGGGDRALYIQTVHGCGYRIVPPIAVVLAAPRQQTPRMPAGSEVPTDPLGVGAVAAWPALPTPTARHEHVTREQPDAADRSELSGHTESAAAAIPGRGSAVPLAIVEASVGDLSTAVRNPETARPNPRPRPNRRTVVAAVAGVAAVFALAPYILSRAGSEPETTPPRIVGYTQLTHDRSGKPVGEPLLTDGRFVFFAFESGAPLIAVPVHGGEPRLIDHLRRYRVDDVSRNGETFLGARVQDPGAEDGLWTLPAAQGSPRRLGRLSANGSAAWSPGGDRVAYGHDLALHVARADGAEVTRVATMPWRPMWPRWSPDGKVLRFTLLIVADRKDRKELWEVKADGTGLRRLLEGWGDEVAVCCGNWTPDGRYYVFQATRAGRTDLWMLDERTIQPGSLIPTAIQLTFGPLSFSSPLPSRDGQRIFAFGVEDRGELVRYEPELQEFVPYLGGLSAIWVSFSPDARRISYVAYPEKTLWRSSIDGSEKRQLTFPPMRVDGVSWSPDGTTIAFRGALPGKRTKIFLIPAEGGSPEALTPDEAEQGVPSWSPDGTKLVFGDVAEAFGHATGAERLHIYDLRRRTVSEVPGSHGRWTSRWSPDGRYLSALTNTGQNHTLTLFDFATSTWRSLGADHVGEPAWSRDSRYIYYDTVSGLRRLRRVRIADGVVDDIFDFDRTRYPLVWTGWGVGLSPDDSPMVLRNVAGPHLYALELAQR